MPPPLEDEVSDQEYQDTLAAATSLITSDRRGNGASVMAQVAAMPAWLDALQLATRLPDLSVIHVAGTKGKGSTCAMVDSILRRVDVTTGLFTSPHLCDIRERFRINGKPISKALFVKHFWAVHDALRAGCDAQPGLPMPPYFRFLTLLGLAVFIEAGVDVAILEVGLGGRLDATNVCHPTVCGISSLGFDHMEILGDTLPLIAKEKGGILKQGIPAFTSPQPDDAMQALQECAAAAGTALQVTPDLASFQAPGEAALEVGLAGEHQRINAALAVHLAARWEAAQRGAAATARAAEVLSAGRLPPQYKEGLRLASWPGRAQMVELSAPGEPDVGLVTLFLDGAHTPESMTTCGTWFLDSSAALERSQRPAGGVVRVLLFNCMRERSPELLLQPLHAALQAQPSGALHDAVFVPAESAYATVTPGGSAAGPNPAAPDLTWQHSLRGVWSGIASGALAPPPGQQPKVPLLPPPPRVGAHSMASGSRACGSVSPSLVSTLEWLRMCGRAQPKVAMHVLVTGSLYLVGDVLRLLNKLPK